MDCPECALLTEAIIFPKWKCDCGEVNCIHIGTCPKCLVTRDARTAPESQMHPGHMKQQIFEYCMFQTAAISIGLNLQLAEALGMDREALSKVVFDTLRRNLGHQAQSILTQVYGKLPVNEVDRVRVRELVTEFVGTVRMITEQVKKVPPPDDIGTREPK